MLALSVMKVVFELYEKINIKTFLNVMAVWCPKSFGYGIKL